MCHIPSSYVFVVFADVVKVIIVVDVHVEVKTDIVEVGDSV